MGRDGSYYLGLDRGKSENKRKSCFTGCREHAVEAARKGLGVNACPYESVVWSTVWTKAYFNEAQGTLDLQGA